jgi:DNA-binding transcriptional LysR family regulator
MLDAHQLHVFLVAAEHLNFTAAARQLHMTQPSVSQHIQTLEQRFDAPLFLRSGRQLSLTAAGEALVPLARQMVDLSLNVDELMSSLHGEVHGHLQVGCSTTAGKYVLPFLLASFLRRFPKVQATCQVTARRQAVQDLCDGRVHLALASPSDFPREVEFRRFLSDPVLLIAPVDHPWADAGTVDVDDLKREKFILREQGSGTRAAVDQGLMEVGLSVAELDSILTLGNSEAIALAVQEGVGVGFVSQCVVARLVNEGVKVVSIEGVRMRQDVYIGRHSRQPATVAQAAFWEFATDPHSPLVDELLRVGFREPLMPAENGSRS